MGEASVKYQWDIGEVLVKCRWTTNSIGLQTSRLIWRSSVVRYSTEYIIDHRLLCWSSLDQVSGNIATDILTDMLTDLAIETPVRYMIQATSPPILTHFIEFLSHYVIFTKGDRCAFFFCLCLDFNFVDLLHIRVAWEMQVQYMLWHTCLLRIEAFIYQQSFKRALIIQTLDPVVACISTSSQNCKPPWVKCKS